MASIGIVGGGVLGMTLALRLREKGHDVSIIEGAAAPGGLAASQTIGGYTWDRFYHVILASDAHLRALLDELGFHDRLRWATTKTGFYVDGTLYSLSSSLEFLTFPPLSLVDKARLAATIMYASRVRDWRRLESIPVTDWLRTLSGSRTFDRIWLPLLKSKLGENYRITSASFIWAIIARMYAARRSGLKREQFGYVDGGYEPVMAAFREHLAARGVELLCGSPVSGVRERGDGAVVTLANGDLHAFDRVVLTIPSSRIPALCPDLTDAESERLQRVVYQGVICASVLLRKPLADYYVTNITDAAIPFTGVIEMTALVDRARFGGNSLVYLPRYLVQGDAYWHATDEDIQRDFTAALEAMYPNFHHQDILAFRIARARDVLAISTLDYSDRALPPLHTSLPSVFIVNSAQIASGTLNLNETVGLANSQAAALLRLVNAREEAPAHA